LNKLSPVEAGISNLLMPERLDSRCRGNDRLH